VIRPSTDDPRVTDEEQSTYRSVVGTLLQFIKYSRPDIANAVRELSKCMDAATPAAYKEMRRVIKFLLDTKEQGLKIFPRSPHIHQWRMAMYSDSDWAGDKNTCRSVTGYILFLVGVPILWKSKLQASVSLSSSEAEYYALSEAAKEIKFVAQLLRTIGVEPELPITVHVDNVGAIFMSENVSATSRTRHVDARYHFVREFIEEGQIKIVFVKQQKTKQTHSRRM